MTTLPGGTLTLFFSDIEESTRLLHELGSARYGELLDRHHDLMREAVAEHSGVGVDAQGDSFFAAFPRAGDAVAAALDAQRSHAGTRWPGGAEVRVRIGLHTGEPRVAGDHYVGMAVHRGARTMDAAHGGQVLLSEPTADVVGDEAPAGVTLRDLGEHELAGLNRPQHLYQLVADGLPSEFPPPNTLAGGRAGRLEFRILGPLEVRAGTSEVPAGGRKPRALLAVLLLHPNEVVPADRLIDELWGEDSPEDAAAALRVNVSRLRKALPPDVLTTRSPGYVLRVEPDALDLHRFERLVDEGRSLLARGLASDASERLRDALSLWRGPPLADFAYESFAQTAIGRLEEIKLAAVELRIDADLALGRHDELVGELEALVAAHPLRERLRRNLMTALYRAGRQAEALDAYHDARRILVDELGLEPSPALQELERAILRQEAALNLPATAPEPAGEISERSILVATADETRANGLLAIAELLVRDPPRVMVLARLVPDAAELRSATAWLEERRSGLEARGITARAASFTTTSPGAELARLATELDVELLLADATDELLVEGAPDEQLAAVLAEAPCDVALLVPRDTRADGPVLVPFGGAEHDWAAVELAAWLARAGGAPLRLAGSAAVPEHGRRDASRLLSHGALAVQRVLGISAEPLLTPPGEEGMLEASRDAGLLVVGLSTRWHREGLGPARLRLAKDAVPPTLFVRKGLRPGGLAPPATLTRFTWSIRPQQAGS